MKRLAKGKRKVNCSNTYHPIRLPKNEVYDRISRVVFIYYRNGSRYIFFIQGESWLD